MKPAMHLVKLAKIIIRCRRRSLDRQIAPCVAQIASASGDQTIDRLAAAISLVRPSDHRLYIELPAFARIERGDTPIKFRPQRTEPFDIGEEFAADTILIRLRQPGDLCDGPVEQSGHAPM